jgi:DNA phosphorothioation-dependent restriction protein DptG
METRLGQLYVLRLRFHTEVQEYFLHNVANLLANYSSLKQCQVFFQKLKAKSWLVSDIKLVSRVQQ